MPQLKGVIKTPTGELLGGATITLTSLHNRAGILKSVFSHVTTQNGEYDFPVMPGVYSIRLTQSTQRLSEIGVIRVYEDSADGSLNDFLGATDIDLRPEALKKYEELVQQAQQSAEAAAESEQQAGKHAGAAALAKEEVKKLAAGVQQNAEAVAENKRQVEMLASQIEDTASEVRQDAEAAKKAASDAEQAWDEIDTALSVTLKTANHLSEIAAEGEEAQQKSRDSLGLKSAATMEPQIDIRDRTEGRLTIPGAFGFGHIFDAADVIRFSAESEFLDWAAQATPGEYSVNSPGKVIPGGVRFEGMISIRWMDTSRDTSQPESIAKAIIFYGVNGDIYYNRYWPAGDGHLTGWINLKVNEASLRALIETRAPLNSPALTGKPTTPTPADDAAGTEIANAAFVRKLLAALVDSSPEALDTLNELAAALGNDPNFATTITNVLAGKQPLNVVLTAISELTQRADNLLCFNADGDASLSPLSEKARLLLAQTTPEEMKSVLELQKDTYSPQSDIYDRTEGRLALPGAFGFGYPFGKNDRITFENTSELTTWVKNAYPGRYAVAAPNQVTIIPGISFTGILDVIWQMNRFETKPPSDAVKCIMFYAGNGDIWFNRYLYGRLVGWERIKISTADIYNVMGGAISNEWGDPDVGGLIIAAYQGITDGDTKIKLVRGQYYAGSRLGPVGISAPYNPAGTYSSTPRYYVMGNAGHSLPGTYRALSGITNTYGSDAMIGLFIRTA